MVLLRIAYLLLLFARYNCFFILGLLNSKCLFLFNIQYNKNSQKQAQRFTQFLVSAGPVFIKLAQVISTRVDLFSETYITELKKLRDSVNPIAKKHIVKIIERDFNQNIADIFLELSDVPLASASIAQVHKAKLLDGKDVIVKVIKPKTSKLFRQDIALLKLIFTILQTFSKRGKISKPLKIVTHLEEVMKLELDLRFECASMDELRDNFVNDKVLYIPKIYWNYVSQNVLVEEFIDGVSLNNVSELKNRNLNLNKITEDLTKIFFLQILRDGYFHADMHAGNIFVNKSGQVAFVDFGIMGRLSLPLRKYLFDLFLAFVNKDYKKASEIHFQAGWISNKYNVDDFALACRSIMAKLLDKAQKDIKIGELLQQLFIISGNFEMEIQQDLLLLQKNLMYLENLGRVLSPNENMWLLSKKIISDNIDKNLVFKDTIKNKYKVFLNEAIQIKNNFLNYNKIIKENNDITLNNSKLIRILVFFVFFILVLLILR